VLRPEPVGDEGDVGVRFDLPQRVPESLDRGAADDGPAVPRRGPVERGGGHFAEKSQAG